MTTQQINLWPEKFLNFIAMLLAQHKLVASFIGPKMDSWLGINLFYKA